MIFDNCADVFEILNDSREYFWLFLMVYFFSLFLSLPVEQRCDSGSRTVLRFGGEKKFVVLELLYSSESYILSFGIFLI